MHFRDEIIHEARPEVFDSHCLAHSGDGGGHLDDNRSVLAHLLLQGFTPRALRLQDPYTPEAPMAC